MLDKTIPHYTLKFVYKPGVKIPDAVLPEGFSWHFWQPGDQQDWSLIETAVDEFATVADAQRRFNIDFLPYPEELSQRLFFIVSPTGQRIGNCAAWWHHENKLQYPLLHYLAVLPEFQGLRLGRALVLKTLQVFSRLNPKEEVRLGTQTWSWPAICLYLSCGFQLVSSSTDPSAFPVLKEKMPAVYYQQLVATKI